MLRDYLLARWIGFGPTLDAYLFALGIQAIVIGFVTSIVSIGLIQSFSRAQVDLHHSFAVRLVVVGAVSAIAGALVASLADAQWLVAGALICSVGPALASAAFSARLVAANRQLTAVVPGLGLAVVPLVAAVAFGRTLDLRQLVVVTLSAYLLEMIVLAVCVRAQCSNRLPGLRRSLTRSSVIGLGGASLIGTIWLTADLAVVRSLGPSAVSVYSLGSRVPLGLAGVLVLAITNVLLPGMSAAVTDGASLAANRRVVRRHVQVGIGAGSLIAVLLVAATSVSDLLFAGSKVSPSEARDIFMVQAILGLMLPPYMGGIVLVRYLQSSGSHHAVIRAGIQAMVVNVVADIVLAHFFGIRGIAAASVLAYATSAAYLAYAARTVARKSLSSAP